MTEPTLQEILDKEKKKPSEAEVKFAKQGIKIENINRLLFFTFFSFLFYVGNICWDIYSLIRYWNRKDDWYFRCTLAFVLGPMVIKTIYNYDEVKNKEKKPFLRIVGLCQIPRYVDLIKHGFKAKHQAKLKTDEPQNEPLKDEKDEKDEKDQQDQTGVKGEAGLSKTDGLNGLPGASGKNGKDGAPSRSPGPKRDDGKSAENGPQQGPTSETGSTGPPGFRQDQQDKQYTYFVEMIWEDAELVQLSQFNTFMTSAPKLLLILYILITGKSELGVVSMIRIIISIGILAFAIVSYEKKICLINGIKLNEDGSISNDDAIKCFNQTYGKTIAIQFFAHFCWIVARFIALSLFTSVFGWIVVPVCLAHLIPIFVWHWTKNYNFMYSLRLSFLHVFAYLYPAEKESDQKKHPRFSPVMYQTICICENLALMVMWSQSLIKFDEGINPGILSISYYPWSDWTFFVPWIGQISTFTLSFISFWVLEKVRKDNQQTLPTTDPAVQEQAALANP